MNISFEAVNDINLQHSIPFRREININVKLIQQKCLSSGIT